MKFRNLVIILFANLRFVFVSAKTKEFLQAEQNGDNFVNFQYLNEKKVNFTKSTAQYVKFGVNLPNLLDFAMCLWYKPTTILEHNILFSYGNEKEQLILWKIKKKYDNKPAVVFRIFNILIMEEKLEGLVPGQWHHLCQYWQGSTGLWALFFDNYIVSFGYSNVTNFNWSIKSDNFSATINHPRTKDTLHGEIYGFHLTSLELTSNENRLKGTNTQKLNPSKLRKRQTESIPVDAEPRPLFFLGKLFTFVRRVVSFVAVPVFRFVRGLIVPWRKPFSSSKPTTEKIIDNKLPPSSVTEIITDFRSVTENTTTRKGVKIETAYRSKGNESLKLNTKTYSSGKALNHADLAKLEESIVIYEVDSDNESRYLRNILNNTNHPKQADVDSVELLIQPEESSKFQTYSNDVLDKCSILERKFNRHFDQENHNLPNGKTESASENSKDAITHLGTSLQFMQFLYSCCHFHSEKILLSWDTTKTIVNNVMMKSIAGCGNF